MRRQWYVYGAGTRGDNGIDREKSGSGTGSADGKGKGHEADIGKAAKCGGVTKGEEQAERVMDGERLRVERLN